MCLIKYFTLIFVATIYSQMLFAIDFCVAYHENGSQIDLGCFQTIEIAIGRGTSQCKNCELELRIQGVPPAVAEAKVLQEYQNEIKKASRHLELRSIESYKSQAALGDFKSSIIEELETLRIARAQGLMEWMARARRLLADSSSQSAQKVLERAKLVLKEGQQLISNHQLNRKLVSSIGPKEKLQHSKSDALLTRNFARELLLDITSKTEDVQGAGTKITDKLSDLSKNGALDLVGKFAFDESNSFRSLYGSLIQKENSRQTIEDVLESISEKIESLNGELEGCTEKIRSYISKVTAASQTLSELTVLELFDIHSFNLETPEKLLQEIEHLKDKVTQLAEQTEEDLNELVNRKEILDIIANCFPKRLFSEMSNKIILARDRFEQLITHSIVIVSKNNGERDDL